MKHNFLTVYVLIGCITFCSCSGPQEKEKTNETAQDAKYEPTNEELIARGKYLTLVSGCHDCHSPKVMTEKGPELDTTRLLSGHPQNEKLPPVIKTQDWVLFNNTLTAAVGPWGASYSANLTPDETGIGNWKFEQFLTAIREGKYKGLKDSRPLLPPMPWQMIRNMTDEDLLAIFTYLKSIRPVNNLVPAAIPPDKLLSKK